MERPTATIMPYKNLKYCPDLLRNRVNLCAGQQGETRLSGSVEVETRKALSAFRMLARGVLV